MARPSLGMWLFLIGFHGLFFLPLIFPVAAGQSLSGVTRYYLLSQLLILAGAWLETRASRMRLLRRHPIWTAFFVLAIGALILRSLIGGASPVIVYMRVIALAWLPLIPGVAMRTRNWPWIWASLILHAMVGIAYALWVFSRGYAVTREAIGEMQGQNFLAICLYGAPFVLLVFPLLRGWILRLGGLALVVAEMLRTLFFAARLPWLLLPLQLLMLVYAYTRAKGGRRSVELLAVLTVAAAISLPIAFAVLNSSAARHLGPRFQEGYDGLMRRMLEKGSIADTVRENERWREAHDSMVTMQGIDWLVGKGVDSPWAASDFAGGEDRYMIHNTWLNSIYWGGVALPLVLIAPLFWTLPVFLRSRDLARVCFASFVLFMYIKFPAYLITMPTHEWILFCLALGACLPLGPVSRPAPRVLNRPTVSTEQAVS